MPNDQHNNRAIALYEYEQIAVATGLSGLLYYDGTTPIHADSTGRHVKMRPDVVGWIRGTRFNNDSETILPIAGNTSGKTRIDLVVLRKRRQESSLGAGDQHTVAPVVIQGVAADNPIAPSPVRSASSATSFYDVVLGEVTVPADASTTTAGQVVCRAYYVNGMGYTGRDAWGKPPVEPGVLFHAVDTGKTYIGSAAGSWLVLYDDSGWVPVPLANGWSKSTTGIAQVRRINRVGYLNLDVFRTGDALSAGSVLMGTLPAGFPPDSPTHIVPGSVSGIGGTARFVIDNAGNIRIDNFTPIATGKPVSTATSWPLVV